jgi:hypothetical protein
MGHDIYARLRPTGGPQVEPFVSPSEEEIGERQKGTA